MWVQCEWVVDKEANITGPFANLPSDLEVCTFEGDEPDTKIDLEISKFEGDVLNDITMSFYVPLSDIDTYNSIKHTAETMAKAVLDGITTDIGKSVDYIFHTPINTIIKDNPGMEFVHPESAVEWMDWCEVFMHNPLYPEDGGASDQS